MVAGDFLTYCVCSIHHFYTGNCREGTTKDRRGYSPAQDWARARRGLSASGSARLGAGAEGGPGAQVLRAGALLVRFFVGVAAASWSTLKARRRRKKDSRRSSQMGDWGVSRPRVVSEEDESVLFSKMDQPSTTCEGNKSTSESGALEVAVMISALEGAGPSSSSLSTTVKGEEMCWRESWGRCILFQRRKAWPARREKSLG